MLFLLNNTKLKHLVFFMHFQKLSSIRLAGTSLLIVFAFAFAACSDLNLDDTEGVGQMNFYMSDATESSKALQTNDLTADSEDSNKSVEGVEEVNIDVQELRVHFTANAADTVDNGEEEGEWVEIPMAPAMINLLDLSDADTLLAEAELDEGHYSQIRLILGDNSEIVVDGETYPLTVPSGQQSGYKIKLGEDLNSGQEMDVTIEFDSDKSIHVTGNGKYMLKPVLKAFDGRNGEED